MKKTLIISALLALAIGTPSAFAKGGKGKGGKGAATSTSEFAKYDTNADGVLEDSEKSAIKKAFDTDSGLKKYDTNGDGKLDDSEISAIKPAGTAAKKKKK
ncbi:MAG: calcium-binding protein [Verrucomicrobia bacterium]|nr:calcium-binding protein [Verrucomicrobiota bacterium]